MNSLLQISDPHFGTEQPAVVTALLSLAGRLAPALVVLSGDVTQRATSEEFASARAFLDRIDAPATLVIPGNHDIPLLNLPLRVVAPFSRYRRVFGRETAPLYQDDRMQVIGVNTVVPRWHKDGAVGAAQISRVSQHLQQSAATQLRIVVCHHPVAVIRPEDDENLLQRSPEAVPRWVAAGADMILGGHIHLPYVRPLSHRFPDLARRAWAVQAGTALSSRTRAGVPNSVNHLRPVDGERGLGCIVERWDFIAASGEFEIVDAQRLLVDRGAGAI